MQYNKSNRPKLLLQHIYSNQNVSYAAWMKQMCNQWISQPVYEIKDMPS